MSLAAGMSGKKKKMVHKSMSSLEFSKDLSKGMEQLKQNEVVYKSKIRALELEVETLRYRLDSLRKAKNTTIVRREREEIRIATPSFCNQPSPKSSLPLKPHPPFMPFGYQDQVGRQIKDFTAQVERLNSQLTSEREWHNSLLEEMKESHKRELSELKEAHAEMAEDLSRLAKKPEQDQAIQVSTSCKDCEDIRRELEKLQSDYCALTEQMEPVLVTNEALRRSSLMLQERSAALLEELSVKEAEWSHREDKLQAAIREQWGQRYHEWIAKAEKKMAELQEVNAYLQQTMRKL